MALLDAALSLVRKQGWAATSIDQLCRATGVTKGAFLIAGPIFAGVVAGAYGLARTIFIRMSRNRERMLRTAVERVAQRVRECIAARQLERSRETPRLRR